jgi:branched-chain amino acid aminotransferase
VAALDAPAALTAGLARSIHRPNTKKVEARERDMTDWSETWTFYNGRWQEGNFGILGPRSHAFWCGSSVFDGARAFEGVMPDAELHFARVNRSAEALGLAPTVSVDDWMAQAREGLTKFTSNEAIYLRPMYWAEEGGFMSVPPLAESTQALLCMYVTPMPEPKAGFSMCVSPFRRPTIETAPTNAKAGCLYPNNGRALRDAIQRGYENALILDMLGNVAETATSNIFAVKDGLCFTPVPTGCFLDGITRQRTIGLLRAAGTEVVEKSMSVQEFLDADEIFSTGNYSKIVPVTRFEERDLQPGPMAQKARNLYWDWAHS